MPACFSVSAFPGRLGWLALDHLPLATRASEHRRFRGSELFITRASAKRFARETYGAAKLARTSSLSLRAMMWRFANAGWDQQTPSR